MVLCGNNGMLCPEVIREGEAYNTSRIEVPWIPDTLRDRLVAIREEL